MGRDDANWTQDRLLWRNVVKTILIFRVLEMTGISLLDVLLLASGASSSLFVIQGLGRPVPGRGNS